MKFLNTLAQNWAVLKNKAFLLFAILLLLSLVEMGLFTLWRSRFDPHILPFYFLGIQLSIGILPLFLYAKSENRSVRSGSTVRVISLSILVLIGIIVAFGIEGGLFRQIPVSISYSDILPQVQKLTHRFTAFEYPYAIIHDFGYPLSPTYLPAQWMPYLPAEILKIDPRNISFGVFALAYAVFSYQLIKNKLPLLAQIVLLVLPIVFVSAVSNQDHWIWTVSIEQLIMAYYLLLGLSLTSKSPVFQIVTIVLCLMSRFSLVFWLPLYIYMLWTKEEKKPLLHFCLLILGSCLLLYGPFLLQDLLTFTNAQAAYDKATVIDWTHKGHIKDGLGFALYFSERDADIAANMALIKKTMLVLTSLVSLGLAWVWWKKQRTLNFRLFAVCSLKISLAVFYAFVEIPYAYLYVTPLVLSWVILYITITPPQYFKAKPILTASFLRKFPYAAILFSLVAILFFIAQLDTALFGRLHYDAKTNSVFLFSLNVLAALFAYTLFARNDFKLSLQPTHPVLSLVWGIFGVLCIWAMQGLLTKVFSAETELNKYTDIFLQLNAQADRLLTGKMPYADLWVENSYNAYPAYMPAHFMPVTVALKTGLDARWVGIGLLGIANFAFGVWISRLKTPILLKVLGLMTPSVILWYFIGAFQNSKIFELAIPYTAETYVVAYYLILFIGLLWDNFYLIVLGLCLCLLSRYTVVFWLPIFALIYFKTKPLSQNIRLWGIVVGSVLACYVLPFWIRDTSIFTKGMIHYREAILSEWVGVEGISYSFTTGVYLAEFFKDGIAGDISFRIQTMRWVQLGVLAFTMLSLLWVWWRNRTKIQHSMAYTAISLHILLTVFYAFSPLTYRYYLMTTLTLAGVLCFLTMHWAFHLREKVQSE